VLWFWEASELMVLFDAEIVVFAYRVGESLLDMFKDLMDLIGVLKVEF
jgi:hypothetical protein